MQLCVLSVFFVLASVLSVVFGQNTTAPTPNANCPEHNTTIAPPQATVPPTQAPTDDDFFQINCSSTSHSECQGIEHSKCANDSNGLYRCRCLTEENWKRDQMADKCVKYQWLGHRCKGSTVCMDRHAECMDDGTNTGTMRCRCTGLYTDHIQVKKADGTSVCAKLMTKATNSSCTDCINNEGQCYNMPRPDGSLDGSNDGCICPISRSGPACEKIHVNVSCNLDSFTMDVCYTPHDDYINKTIKMYPENKDVTACNARLVTNVTATPQCDVGSYAISMPLSVGERDTCGTRELHSGKYTTKYENKFVIKGSPSGSNDWKLFKTYCSFNSHADTSAGGIIVEGQNGNDRGEHKDAVLNFRVYNDIGEVIPKGVAIRLNDKVRLKLILTDDGTYAAIKPTMCTASSSASMPDPKAYTMPLLTNGCPPKQSTIMTEGNRFKRALGSPNVVETGLLKMFKTPISNFVVIHCKVQLCLKGSEDDCLPEDCTNTNRRRRAATAGSEENAVLSMTVFEEQNTSGQTAFAGLSTVGFAVIISLLVAVVFIGVTVSAILILKNRNRNKVGDNVELTQKPQRFALPRVNRNHMRL